MTRGLLTQSLPYYACCMPSRAPHPCNKPGCPSLTNKRFCEPHTQESKQRWRADLEAKRPSARERGYDSRWEKASKGYLAKCKLCVQCCNLPGRVSLATVVDHIIPHQGDMKLFWDRRNWQGLCEPHHRIKTAREVAARRKLAAEKLGHSLTGEGG